jgi:hypothetical protein
MYSSRSKNRDRSFGVIGAGPAVLAPPCRSCYFKSRMASAPRPPFSISTHPPVIGFHWIPLDTIGIQWYPMEFIPLKTPKRWNESSPGNECQLARQAAVGRGSITLFASAAICHRAPCHRPALLAALAAVACAANPEPWRCVPAMSAKRRGCGTEISHGPESCWLFLAAARNGHCASQNS